ncbi:MAG: histidine--tRNA ligase, partial [Rhodocyclaceae bacterium]|nr:histidine--tRNA ligase [Rhodocyclaceae bacterium]
GVQPPRTPLDVYLVHQGELADRMASSVAEQLRDAGLRVAMHCGGGSFKSQMKKADGSGAACAVIIGDDEAAQQAVMLKPLRGGGEQQRVALQDMQYKICELIK